MADFAVEEPSLAWADLSWRANGAGVLIKLVVYSVFPLLGAMREDGSPLYY